MKSAGDSDSVVDGPESSVNSLRMSLRERPPKINERKRKSDETKFLEDFDPEKSNREKRKMKRKNTTINRSYDEYGHVRHNGLDLCDCLSLECPGCWFDCENCGSQKCGVQCRVNRKIIYEAIAFDGKDTEIKNKFFPTK